MKPISKLLLVILSAGIIGGCSLFGKKNTSSTDKTTSPAAIDLRNNMRKLWDDNIAWTRNVIICVGSNAPGADQALARLKKNQEDIVNTMVIYYSDASPKLTDLMEEHLTLTNDLLKGAKGGGKGKKKRGPSNSQDLEKKWDDNTDAIADYFSKTNPAVKSDNIKTLVHDYLKMTKEEVDERRKKDYDGEVITYDKMRENSLNMADSISLGIIHQFPDKF
jgi:hypothetical protein